jgi:hypothetical protein
MNHASLAIGAILTVALIGAAGFSMQQQNAAAQTNGDNSETNFEFKQKLSNNCSGFANCTNTGLEQFGGLIRTPTPGPLG